MATTSIIKYLSTVLLAMAVDAPYLYSTKNVYQKRTDNISGKPYTKRYYSVVAVYLTIGLALMLYALPYIRKDTLSHTVEDSIIHGGLLGITTYAIFDFTMHFMFEGWDLAVSIQDSLWGGVLFSIVSIIITLAFKHQT